MWRHILVTIGLWGCAFAANITVDVSCNDFATSYGLAACCGQPDGTEVMLNLPLKEVTVLNEVYDATSLSYYINSG